VDGFWSVDVAPFPKSQYQLVTPPLDSSLKLTTSGEHPSVIFAEKLAVGACAVALTVINRKPKIGRRYFKFRWFRR
jgi:hypothetical protein